MVCSRDISINTLHKGDDDDHNDDDILGTSHIIQKVLQSET
jgi:hypothetical protein